MYEALGDFVENGVLVYLDDFLVYAENTATKINGEDIL